MTSIAESRPAEIFENSHASREDLHKLREELSSHELDQGRLFEGWPSNPQDYTAHQLDFLSELYTFSESYPGGVQQYIRNGKTLLVSEDAPPIAGDSDDGFQFQLPPLLFDSPSPFEPNAELEKIEKAAAPLLKKTVFVVVAGGLGERLGYADIKVSMPVETATGTCYLAHYMQWVLQTAGPNTPFVIMTSNDTHTRTVELLSALNMNQLSVRIVKQETVFCFSDKDAHLAVTKSEDGHQTLLRKPHGHGDVHSLLYLTKTKNGAGEMVPLVDRWADDGYEHICFFQDTNAAATITIPISLAVSEREDLDMNFTCVPRQPKEAIGLLCRARKGTAPWRVRNVEYNVFAEVSNDVAEPGKPYSPYPGSINTLIYKLSSYNKLLKESDGCVPEFINPKWADDQHTIFKKPARVESLMQDFAEFYNEEDFRVGGVVFDRFLYQAVKNSIPEAGNKAKAGLNPYWAGSGEATFYELVRRRLRGIGLDLEDSPNAFAINDDLSVSLFPIVTLNAVASGDGSLEALHNVFPCPQDVQISKRSVLIVEGHVRIVSLQLDGAVKIIGPTHKRGEPFVVSDLKVSNGSWHLRRVTPDDKNASDQIRGYVLEKALLQVESAKL